jgi:hypothetical protein
VVDYFPAALALVQAGFPGIPQRGEATHHPPGVPYDCQIDPEWTIAKIERFIRAMIYPPLRPAQFEGRDILDFDDYRQALADRWKARNARKHRVTVSQ